MRDYPARLIEEEAASCGYASWPGTRMERREAEETRPDESVGDTQHEASTRQPPEQVTAQCSPARNLRVLHCVLGCRSIMIAFSTFTNTEEKKTDNKSRG